MVQLRVCSIKRKCGVCPRRGDLSQVKEFCSALLVTKWWHVHTQCEARSVAKPRNLCLEFLRSSSEVTAVEMLRYEHISAPSGVSRVPMRTNSIP